MPYKAKYVRMVGLIIEGQEAQNINITGRSGNMRLSLFCDKIMGCFNSIHVQIITHTCISMQLGVMAVTCVD